MTIFAAVLLFHVFAPQSIEAACFAAMLASTFGETVSFTTGWLLYRRSLRKNTPKQKEKGRGVLHGMFHIAVPCTLSSAARGLLQGMAMPMLFFPSSFLSSFAFLLIPRMAKAFELGQRDHVARITEKALHAALLFGIFCAGVFFTFGGDWGRAFYQNTEAGGYLKILAPLVPLLYLDVVVDSLLKGLDEQLNSMKYNFSDSFLRVILILLCMRFYGMRAYIAILFFSSIFNAALSVRRLLQVSQVHIRTVRSVLLPGVFSGFAAALTRGILTPCTFSGIPRILLQTALCGAFYLAMLALSAALQNRREDTKIRLPSV